MDLTVLAVPDCPNVMLLEERLAQVLEGRREVNVSRQVIADQDEATRRGMHGSPTILVDGIDPFAEPGQPASVSCRLYRDGNGRVDGAPSVSQLRQAIGEAAATATDAGWSGRCREETSSTGANVTVGARLPADRHGSRQASWPGVSHPRPTAVRGVPRRRG
jgi:hypothetical protein